MTLTTTVTRLRIDRIGEAARRLLAPGQRGRVLATFSNVAYLVVEGEELVWLGLEDTPMHRRCLHISGSLPRVPAGTSFAVEDGCVRIDPSVRLDFGQATIWRLPQLAESDMLEIAEIPKRAVAICSTIVESQIPRGFGAFLPGILAVSKGQSTDPRAPRRAKTDRVVALAWPAVREIAQACLARDTARLIQRADSLVGLGQGLTPSGDDFLGGVLFCLHYLSRTYPGLPDIPDVARRVETYREQTNLISYTILRDLAAGHGMHSLHQFIESVLAGQSLERAHRRIRQVVRLGHSTGWDLLTGILTGLLMTFHSVTNGHDSVGAAYSQTGQIVPA